MTAPSRFPNGLTNVAPNATFGQLGLPDPTTYHTFFDDFDKYVAADWTITDTGVATHALTDADGGVLLLTNASADNNSSFYNKVGESFLPTSDKKLFFKARFAVSDATQSDWIIGLAIKDTTPVAAGGDGVTDGIFFQKDDGDTNIDFYVQKDTTTGQLISTAIATAAAAGTFMTLAFYFDGARYVYLSLDGSNLATIDLTETLATYLPDTELTLLFGIVNGEAVAKTLSVDYLFVAQER